MSAILKLQLTIFIFLISIQVNSQVLFTHFDTIYGLDPTLYNGQYNPNNLPKNIKGHPYLFDTDFSEGEVIINDKTYKNVSLNYDIYNQEILLKYKNSNGADQIISLSKAWINNFTLNYNCFELFTNSETVNKIYQVIGTDSIKVLYYWKKTLHISSNSGNKSYFLSKPEKEMFIYKNDQIIKFKNKNGFIKIFAVLDQPKIKNYLKVNKINIKKSTDFEVYKLITYCNNLGN